ncbi:TPM domain-containing protein [bacterium]|nr:TPM domain-containing protein [bacterium]
MKKWTFHFVLMGTLLITLSLCQAQLPDHMGRAVNDFAGVISSNDEQQMEALSREVLQKTGAAIVVATVENMGGLSEEEYAVQLFQKWRIGQAGEDRGLLILLAVEERRIRIEVGYGLEGLIPDGVAGEILDQYAIPDFQSGEYGQGLYRSMLAVADMIAKDAGVQITGSQSVVQRSGSEQERGGRLGGIFMVIVFIFLMIVTRGRILPWILLGMMSGGRGGGFKGGGFGGGFGGFGGGMSGGGGASRGF